MFSKTDIKQTMESSRLIRDLRCCRDFHPRDIARRIRSVIIPVNRHTFSTRPSYGPTSPPICPSLAPLPCSIFNSAALYLRLLCERSRCLLEGLFLLLWYFFNDDGARGTSACNETFNRWRMWHVVSDWQKPGFYCTSALSKKLS